MSTIEAKPDPLDGLIEKLNAGDFEAAQRVFLAYEPYLRMSVRRHLTGPLRAKFDSMDVVQSVWADVLCGFHGAGWRFADGTHLRAFLVRVARNRLIDRQRKLRHALERETPLQLAKTADLPVTRQPRPSEVAAGEELWERMLSVCPPAHRDLLRMKRRGCSLGEIAEQTGLHPGSVRRILYEVARRLAPVS